MNQNYEQKVFRDYSHGKKSFFFIWFGLLDQLIVLMKGILIKKKKSVLVTHLKIFYIRILKTGYIIEIITKTTPFCCLSPDLCRLTYLI